jgi:T5orf172 domain
MSKEHKERISKIFAGALPPQGSTAHKIIREKIERFQTPQSKKHAAKQLTIFVNSCSALLNNGIGYPVDALLRYYIGEFNHRAATAGLYSMPTSFAFMEAFMEYQRPLCIFLPKLESNTLCSFTDFLDWATSNNQDPNAQTLKSSIENNRIYLFSNTSNPSNLKFRCTNGIDIGVLSAGILRDRNEIIVFLQLAESEAGMSFDFDPIQSQVGLRKVFPFAATQKEGLKISSDLIHERVRPKGMLEGYESVCMMRFDIEKQAILNRAIYQDWGDSYRALVDDIHVLGAKDYESLTIDQRKVYDASVAGCNGYQEVFELCRQFALLPQFKTSYAAHTLHFEQATELKLTGMGIKGKRIIENAIDEVKIFTRQINKIEVPRDAITGNLIVKVPSYLFEDTGYWKLLAPWEQGSDEHGLPEQGRTWVKQDRPERAAQAAYELKPSKFQKSPVADNTRSTFGYIYVMRSAQHEKNVFKIGLTTRESRVRAKELTASTSSVDQFSVMQEWEVSDCHKAEAAIHLQLVSYRVNPKREFFKCDYRHIFSTIHEIVDSINSAD